MSAPKVAVVAANEFSLFHIAVPFLVFDNAARAEKLFDVVLYGTGGDVISSPIGFSAAPRRSLDELEEAEIVIIPFWPHPDRKPEPPLLEALAQAYRKGACVVGLCLGTYVLAYAGLLNNRKAATHWEFERDFKARFPGVDLNTNVLYVDDGGLITSAGTAAGLDCCLYIVRKIYGSAIANKLARTLVIPPHREGGQAQFIEYSIPVSSQNAQLYALLQHLRQHLEQPHSLDALADRLMMSRRTFTRHFRKMTGMSVVAWLTAARLQRAQELLETTDARMDMIAAQSGFQSEVVLRKHFKARFGVSPTDWRRTFQGSR